MARKKASLGCLFWLALVLLVVVIFLFNRTTINRVLESTGFVEVVSQRLQPEEQPAVEQRSIDEPTAAPSEETDVTRPEPTPEPSEPPRKEADEPTGSREADEGPQREPPKVEVSVRRSPPARDPADAPSPTKRRNAKVYFITVDSDGHINLKSAVRSVEYVDSPLTQTINVLLRGPTPPELNQGFLTLIPEGSQLISATVRDGTAVFNFSEAFRYNALGIEGSVAQLKQIVYSATEFPTVEQVQILVQGQKHDYLNGDGVYVGKPITRDGF